MLLQQYAGVLKLVESHIKVFSHKRVIEQVKTGAPKRYSAEISDLDWFYVHKFWFLVCTILRLLQISEIFSV